MKPTDYQNAIDQLNKEMDLMLYAISHDLRAPLRAIDGFSLAVIEDYGDILDDTGRDYLNRVRAGGKKLDLFIEGILQMSRQSRGDMYTQELDLSAMANEVNAMLAERYPDHSPYLVVQDGVTMVMDRLLTRNLLEKLLDNAWKFTRGVKAPRIEIGMATQGGRQTCFVRDNGVGFDMDYAKDRLFGIFQRMHDEEEFEGVGVGLATARRIINRHLGEIRAESELGKGTTIYFHVDGQED